MLLNGGPVAKWEEELLVAWIKDGNRPGPKELIFIEQNLEGEN